MTVARTNIEQEAWPKFETMAELTGLDVFYITGLMATLWNKTQISELEDATAEQIGVLLKLKDKCTVQLVLQSMLNPLVDFVRETKKSGVYEIVGNKKHIENFQKMRGRQSNGGKKSAEVRAANVSAKAKLGAVSKEEKKRSAQLNCTVEVPSSAHYNSMHYNSIQDNALINTPLPPKGELADPLLEIWNKHRGPLKAAKGMSASRRKAIKTRLKENPDLAYWEAVVKRMAESEFMRDKGWATLDWLIKNDNNHLKVSDGNYDNKPAERPSRSALDDIPTIVVPKDYYWVPPGHDKP